MSSTENDTRRTNQFINFGLQEKRLCIKKFAKHSTLQGISKGESTSPPHKQANKYHLQNKQLTTNQDLIVEILKMICMLCVEYLASGKLLTTHYKTA